MKRTKPWPIEHSVSPDGPVPIPADAETVELEPKEVLEALTIYVGQKLGISYKGYGSLNLRLVEGKFTAAQVSIWRPS